ncbi:MAG: universal stress protein [Deltaproteobacteria bacterium]|nr:universal stress protein [Deltaproteobacteria bacterium]
MSTEVDSMVPLKTVLCPIDFSDLSKKELALALEVCQTFGAELVLLHNLAAISPGLTRAWEWQQVHHSDKATSAKAEEQMGQVLRELPKEVRVHASITAGPVATILLGLVVQLPADLVVLGSHGWSTEDHASITERIIDRCPCPVLTIEENMSWTQRFRLHGDGGKALPVVVPTDLASGGSSVTNYAFELARNAGLEIHLLHVVPRDCSLLELERAESGLSSIVPEDLVGRVQWHVRQGDPTYEILALSDILQPGFLVMGEHARRFFRRLFTKDTAREVLHRAPCPVWFVPPGRR